MSVPTTLPRPRSNPAASLAAVGLLLWSLFVVAGVHGAALVVVWASDLSKIQPGVREVLLWSLVHPLLVGAPAVLLLAFMRSRRPAAVVRTIVVATLAASLLLLPRVLLPPDATYLAALLRCGLALALGLALLLWRRRRGGVRLIPGPGWTLALLLPATFLAPWLAYGALGDSVDVLLAVLQALALSLLLAGLSSLLMPALQDTAGSPAANVWLGGFTLAAAAAAIAAAWGQVDQQALLIAILPGLAFPLALLAGVGRRVDAGSAGLLVFLASLGALAFADPRELHLLGLLSEDTALWAMRAAFYNFLVGVALLVLIGLLHLRLLTPVLRRLWAALALPVWAGLALIYVYAGQPGLYGDRFLVVLQTQADLSPAYAIADVDQRRAWVYQTLVAHADATQGELIAWLEERELAHTRYYLVNAIEVQGHVLHRWQLGRHPDVDRILYSPQLRPLPRPLQPRLATEGDASETPWGIEAIAAPRVWSEFGVTGAGVVVGLSDSGVDATHPAIAGSYRGRDRSDHEYNWLDPWYAQPAPYDLSGHGTHTLGTVLGQGGIGVAPGADWFACANLVRNLGNPATYVDCMQFMLAPHPRQGDALRDGRPDLAADVSANSWGCPPNLEGCDQFTLWQAIEALRAAGIFFVASAGNQGPACDSLETPPGNYGNAFPVGAVDVDGNLAVFSSRGPITGAPDQNRGPALLAPGVDVTSAWPGGMSTSSGTSMASPHVAGVVALMWSANPSLRGDLALTERILGETATPYTGIPADCGAADEFPSPSTGFGVVNAYAAVKRALALR